MIPPLAFIFGAFCGGVIARRRGGSWADIAQYAGVFGIIAALIGTVGAVILLRYGIL